MSTGIGFVETSYPRYFNKVRTSSSSSSSSLADVILGHSFDNCGLFCIERTKTAIHPPFEFACRTICFFYPSCLSLSSTPLRLTLRQVFQMANYQVFSFKVSQHHIADTIFERHHIQISYNTSPGCRPGRHGGASRPEFPSQAPWGILHLVHRLVYPKPVVVHCGSSSSASFRLSASPPLPPTP